jgi:hypothetical protein
MKQCKKYTLIKSLTFYSLLVTWCTDSLTFNNCTLCPHCICMFCICLRTNSDLWYLLHKLIGFYNPDEKCLLYGTNWVFKHSSLHFTCKRLNLLFLWELKCNGLLIKPVPTVSTIITAIGKWTTSSTSSSSHYLKLVSVSLPSLSSCHCHKLI